MTISVIVPVYNGGELLARAVTSVLKQTRPPDELILVDDGSTDGRARVVARMGASIRYIHQKNGGCSAARNSGLAHASGEWITFLDADDFWPLDAISAHLQCLRQHPHAQIVGGVTQVMRPTVTGEFEPSEFCRPLLNLSAMLFRGSVFSKVGLFSETLRRSGDFDWFVRAQEAGIPIIWHDQISYCYQHHASGLTGNTDLQRRSQIAVIREAMRRRHANGTAKV